MSEQGLKHISQRTAGRGRTRHLLGPSARSAGAECGGQGSQLIEYSVL